MRLIRTLYSILTIAQVIHIASTLRLQLPELEEEPTVTASSDLSESHIPRGLFHYSETENNMQSKFKLPNFEELDPLRMASDLLGAAAKAQNRRKTLSGVELPLPFGGTPVNLQVSSNTETDIGLSSNDAPTTTSAPMTKEQKKEFYRSRQACLHGTEEECDAALDAYHRVRYGNSLMFHSSDPSTSLASILMPSLQKPLDRLMEKKENEEAPHSRESTPTSRAAPDKDYESSESYEPSTLPPYRALRRKPLSVALRLPPRSSSLPTGNGAAKVAPKPAGKDVQTTQLEYKKSEPMILYDDPPLRKYLIKGEAEEYIDYLRKTKQDFYAFWVSRNYMATTASGEYTEIELNSNVELAHKEILTRLKTGLKADIISWEFYNFSDEIIENLTRIGFKYLVISECRITASTVRFGEFIAQNPKKVVLNEAHAPTWIVDNKILSVFERKRCVSICNWLNDAPDMTTSTNITDALLESPQLLDQGLVLTNYFNAKLSFSAIEKFFKTLISSRRREYDGNHSLGIIGYQEMPAILQYYNKHTWIEWRSNLCNVNNNSFLQFWDIFSSNKVESERFSQKMEMGPTFGISLERSSSGLVENVSIPEVLVHPKIFNDFKAFVQVVQSDIPMKSVVPAGIRLNTLHVIVNNEYGQKSLKIEAGLVQPPNNRNQECQPIEIEKTNIKLPLALENIVKILKLCSSIESFHLSEKQYELNGYVFLDLIMNDSVFNLLMENAVNTEIQKKWCMELDLSNKNRARLRENRTSPLFKNLKIKEKEIDDKKVDAINKGNEDK